MYNVLECERELATIYFKVWIASSNSSCGKGTIQCERIRREYGELDTYEEGAIQDLIGAEAKDIA